MDMEEKTKGLLRGLAAFAVSCTAVFAAFYTVLVCTARDAIAADGGVRKDYFRLGTAAPTVFFVLLALCGVGMLAFGLRLRGKVQLRRQAGNPVIFFLALGAGVLCFLFGVMQAVYAVGFAAEMARPFFWMGAVFAVLGAGYFFFLLLPPAVLPEKLLRTLTALCGVFAVLAMLAFAVALYFDTGLNMNSPFKVMDQLTALLFAFLLLGEVRFLFGEERYAAYLPMCGACGVMGITCGLGSLVAYLLDGAPRRVFIWQSGVYLLLGIYALVRLILAARAASARACPLLAEIEKTAEVRESALEKEREEKSEQRETANEQEEVQGQEAFTQQTIRFDEDGTDGHDAT